MVGSKKQDSLLNGEIETLKPLFLHIYNHLPEDKDSGNTVITR